MAIIVTKPTEGTTPAAYRSYVEALEAISRTEVAGADIENRFEMFDKTPVEYGTQIQQIRVGTGNAKEVDRNAKISAAEYAKLHTRVFQGWTEKRFDTDIKLNDLKSVCGSPEDLAALVAANENRNAESERLDAEDIYYNLIANPGIARGADSTQDPTPPNSLLSSFGKAGASDQTGADITTVSGWLADNGLFEKIEFTAEDTRDARLTKILEKTRRIAKDMTNNNAKYTHTEDNQRFGASMSDLVVLAPQDFINALDVRVRASIRNLEYVDLPEVVETDFPTLHGYAATGSAGEWNENSSNALDAIIILDRRAVGRVVKDREEYADWVQARRATQHTTFLEDLFYYSEVYKAYAILYKKKDIE